MFKFQLESIFFIQFKRRKGGIRPVAFITKKLNDSHAVLNTLMNRICPRIRWNLCDVSDAKIVYRVRVANIA